MHTVFIDVRVLYVRVLLGRVLGIRVLASRPFFFGGKGNHFATSSLKDFH